MIVRKVKYLREVCGMFLCGFEDIKYSFRIFHKNTIFARGKNTKMRFLLAVSVYDFTSMQFLLAICCDDLYIIFANSGSCDVVNISKMQLHRVKQKTMSEKNTISVSCDDCYKNAIFASGFLR